MVENYPPRGCWFNHHYGNYFSCNICVDVPFNSKIVNYLNLSVLVDVELEPPDHVRRRLSDFFDAAGRDRAQDEDRSGFLKKSIFSFCQLKRNQIPTLWQYKFYMGGIQPDDISST